MSNSVFVKHIVKQYVDYTDSSLQKYNNIVSIQGGP